MFSPGLLVSMFSVEVEIEEQEHYVPGYGFPQFTHQVIWYEKSESGYRQPPQHPDVFGGIGCEIKDVSGMDQEVV